VGVVHICRVLSIGVSQQAASPSVSLYALDRPTLVGGLNRIGHASASEGSSSYASDSHGTHRLLTPTLSALRSGWKSLAVKNRR
jgi:hypothetical protein